MIKLLYNISFSLYSAYHNQTFNLILKKELRGDQKKRTGYTSFMAIQQCCQYSTYNSISHNLQTKSILKKICLSLLLVIAVPLKVD
jgi:hypothetical protein